VGIFYWNEGFSSGIHSFAHGSRFYRIMYDRETAEAAIDAAERDGERMTGIIARADLTDIERSLLEKQIAGILGLGNSRHEIRAAIATERSKITRAVSSAEEEAGATRVDDEGPRGLDTSLTVVSFPQISTVNENIRVLDHQSNLKYMLDEYGIAGR
jgi:hypothetical protein